MSDYLGDFQLSTTLYTKFTTVNASGVPTTLGDAPTFGFYANANTTLFTAGVTVTADFNSYTGLNHLQMTVTTSATGIATGNACQLVIATGSVSGVSLKGYVIGEFSVAQRQMAANVTAYSTQIAANVTAYSTQIAANVTAASTNVGAVVTAINTIAPARVTAQGIDVGAIVTAVNTIMPARVTAQGIDVGAIVTAFNTIVPARVTAQGIDVGAIVTAFNTIAPANVTAARTHVGGIG